MELTRISAGPILILSSPLSDNVLVENEAGVDALILDLESNLFSLFVAREQRILEGAAATSLVDARRALTVGPSADNEIIIFLKRTFRHRK
jgi:hypothetical protein